MFQQEIGKNRDLINPCRIGEADKGEAVALGGFSFLFHHDRTGNAGGNPAPPARDDLRIGLHAFALQRPDIIIKRVAGEIETDSGEFLR